MREGAVGLSVVGDGLVEIVERKFAGDVDGETDVLEIVVVALGGYHLGGDTEAGVATSRRLAEFAKGTAVSAEHGAYLHRGGVEGASAGVDIGEDDRLEGLASGMLPEREDSDGALCTLEVGDGERRDRRLAFAQGIEDIVYDGSDGVVVCRPEDSVGEGCAPLVEGSELESVAFHDIVDVFAEAEQVFLVHTATLLTFKPEVEVEDAA